MPNSFIDMNEDKLMKLIKGIKLNTIRNVNLPKSELPINKLEALSEALRVNSTVFSINFERTKVNKIQLKILKIIIFLL